MHFIIEFVKEIFFAFSTFFIIFLSSQPDSRILIFRILKYSKFGCLTKVKASIFLCFNSQINIKTFEPPSGIVYSLVPNQTVAIDRDNHKRYKWASDENSILLDTGKAEQINLGRLFKILNFKNCLEPHEANPSSGVGDLKIRSFSDLMTFYPKLENWNMKTKHINLIPKLGYGSITEYELDLYLFLKYLIK